MIKTLKRYIAKTIARFIPIVITKGPSAGMKLYGYLFYNRRSDEFTAEEKCYAGLDLEDKVVVDAGAHRGVHTYYFAKHAREVFAFEPNPETFAMLSKNIKANGLDNVRAFNLGLADAGGEGVYMAETSPKGTFKKDKQARMSSSALRAVVPLATVDEAVAGPIDFVKIDTEGYEPIVIRGMVETLKYKRPIVYFELHGLDESQKMDDLRQIQDLVEPLDYVLQKIHEDAVLASPRAV